MKKLIALLALGAITLTLLAPPVSAIEYDPNKLQPRIKTGPETESDPWGELKSTPFKAITGITIIDSWIVDRFLRFTEVNVQKNVDDLTNRESSDGASQVTTANQSSGAVSGK